MPGDGSLTTHVLDTMHGKPAAGMRIDLLMLHGDHNHQLLTIETNEDGRADQPLLGEGRWGHGTFELVFHVGQYFAKIGGGAPVPRHRARPLRHHRGHALPRAAARQPLRLFDLSGELICRRSATASVSC